MAETSATPAQERPPARCARRRPWSTAGCATGAGPAGTLSQLARMTEELGELARLVNHLYGEKPKKADEPEQDLGLEMADLLYTMICWPTTRRSIDLQALERVLEKYRAGTQSVTPAPAGAPRA